MATLVKKEKQTGSVEAAVLSPPNESKKVKGKKSTDYTKTKSNNYTKEKYILKEDAGGSIDTSEILVLLTEIRNGNFNVRIPIDRVAISGKIFDTLNEIITINKKLVKEFSRARTTIGKEGRLNQRISLNNAEGE